MLMLSVSQVAKMAGCSTQTVKRILAVDLLLPEGDRLLPGAQKVGIRTWGIPDNVGEAFAKNYQPYASLKRPRGRCEANARKGTGYGMCDSILDHHGQCPYANTHVET